jgi:hypothetical protein
MDRCNSSISDDNLYCNLLTGETAGRLSKSSKLWNGTITAPKGAARINYSRMLLKDTIYFLSLADLLVQ